MKTCKEILIFTEKINRKFLYTGKIDFQEINDFILKLSEGKFSAFNLFVENSLNFKTLGISGDKKIIRKASELLGFSPIGKVWKYDSQREEKIKNQTITVFKKLEDLTSGVFSEKISSVIGKLASIGEVIIVRIEINNKTAGDFTIFMDKDSEFENFEEVELFASQVAILVEKMNISQNLYQEKEKFNFLVEATGAGTWDWNMITNKVTYSKEWKRMLGYLENEVENSFEGWKNLWHPDDVSKIEKSINDYLKEKVSEYEVVHRLKHKNGGWKWILTRGKLERDENGKPIRWAGINIDLTEIKEAKEKHKNLVESSYDIIYRLTTDGKFDYISKAWTTLLGHSAEDVIGKSFRPYVHPEDLKKITDFFDDVKRTKSRMEIKEFRLKHADGSWHFFTTNAVPIWDDSGEIVGYAGTARDISDLKIALEKVIANKEELERFFSINLDLLCITDYVGNFVRINKSWERILGYPVDVIKKTNFLDYIHPDDLELTQNAMSLLNKGEEVVDFINRYRAKNGSYKYIEWRSAPYDNVIYAAARDVTEKIVISEELSIEKELFRTTLMSVGDGVISSDASGFIVLMNQVAQQLTGWLEEEAIGMPIEKIFNIIREDNRESANLELTSAFDNQEIMEIQDILLLSKDGKEIPIEKTSSPIRNSEGYITGVVTVFRDFTERKEKQKEVEYLSNHDYLTGLYNRRYMEDTLKRIDTERNLPISLMVMDVNGLKMANDAFGHKIGDNLLKACANILKEVTRADDILCRIGGDEFMLILPQTDHDNALKIKRRIAEQSDKTLLDSLVVSMAVGYEVKNDILQDINEIQKQADSNMYKDKFKNGPKMRLETVNNILNDIDKKYPHERNHREKVTEFSLAIGEKLGFDEERLEDLHLAASVHDVGKIKISGELLNKKGKLSKEEFNKLKKHSVTGYNILKAVDEYAGIAEEVLHHHESYDGKGYPKGITGEDIPLLSRIITVADAYEAMTSERTYKEAKSKEEAIKELTRCSGTQFDPEIVTIFIRLVEERGY